MKEGTLNGVGVSKQAEEGAACCAPTKRENAEARADEEKNWDGTKNRSPSATLRTSEDRPLQKGMRPNIEEDTLPGKRHRDAENAEARPYNATLIMENEKQIPPPQAAEDRSLRVGMTSVGDGLGKRDVDAEAVWKQIEDVVAPQLGLSVIDHVVYSHLVRHSLLEGKRRLRFSIPWLARNIHLSVCPTREAVRRLAEHGALRLIERSKQGHVAEVRLPEEIPGVRAKAREERKAAQPAGAMDIEDVDFLKTPELRRAIHARERGRCFYCHRRITPRMECLDHVVPRAKVRCNSYRNLVSCCMECNSQKGERSAEEYLRWLFREHRLGAAELSGRFRALEMLTSGKLRPVFRSEEEAESEETTKEMAT